MLSLKKRVANRRKSSLKLGLRRFFVFRNYMEHVPIEREEKLHADEKNTAFQKRKQIGRLADSYLDSQYGNAYGTFYGIAGGV